MSSGPEQGCFPSPTASPTGVRRHLQFPSSPLGVLLLLLLTVANHPLSQDLLWVTQPSGLGTAHWRHSPPDLLLFAIFIVLIILLSIGLLLFLQLLNKPGLFHRLFLWNRKVTKAM